MHSPITRDDDENTPLLSTEPDVDANAFAVKVPNVPRTLFLRIVVGATAALVFLNIGDFIFTGPRLRIYEAIICDHYYEKTFPGQDFGARGGSGIPEELCKIDEVQDDVARLFGWLHMFENIPSILLAVPYGQLSDWMGRRIVLFLSVVGLFSEAVWILFICHSGLPLELSWIGAAFLVIGGGPSVAGATVMTIITDITTPEKRSTVFFYVAGSIIGGGLVGPAIGAYLMEINVWLPMVLGSFIEFIGVLCATIVPETLHHSKTNLPQRLDGSSLLTSPYDEFHANPGWPKKARAILRECSTRLSHSLEFLLRNKSLILIIMCFLPTQLAKLILNDQGVQYASKRYHWKISKASLLPSLSFGLELLLLISVMPMVTFLLRTKFHMLPSSSDLWMARFTAILMAIGSLLMGVSPVPSMLILGVVVYTFGSPTTSLMRSVATQLISSTEQNDTGKTLALIAVFEGSGALLAGPVGSGLFRLGIHRSHNDGNDAWLGLPLLAAAILLTTVIAVLPFVRIPRDQLQQQQQEAEGEDHGDR